MIYDGQTHERRRFAQASVRRRMRVMEQVILDRVRGKDCVLDLGCGTGRFTMQVDARQIVGLDCSRSMLEVARRRGLETILGDGNDLPFADNAFDAVVCTDQVFHRLKQARALAECARVLIADGILALHYNTDAVWTPRSPLSLTPRPRATGLPGNQLIELARKHGFGLEEVRLWRWLRFYPYLFPAPPVPSLRLWNQGVFVFRKYKAR